VDQAPTLVPPDPADGEGILGRGTAIGRFVVLGLLGKGGMGEVYAAHDPELERDVAIKLLRGGATSESPEGRMRLMREAQAIARVSHPNVVVVYDVGTFRNRVFIAMELVAGHTLRYWMHERARTWPEVLEVFAAAGRGLGAAHERELVHRDFKPDNVMIAADGQVRVMDFGLVQLAAERTVPASSAPIARVETARQPRVNAGEEDDLLSTRAIGAPKTALRTVGSALGVELTRTGASLGTPAYMSPEQFRDERTDARTDQFSFCVALYEALYGERPFRGASVQDLSESVCSGTVSEPPERTQVPGWIREALLRGLQRSPDGRWPSMKALLAELEKQPAITSRRRFIAAAAEKLEGIWEVSRGQASAETPAKAAMQDAFLASGKAYAAKAWDGASQILDRFARRWTELYVEACEATHVRGEQSAEVLDLRMECLREGLEDLGALVRMFRRPTAQVVENAVSAASALGNLERCENIELLRAVIRPPQDPSTRQEVDRLRAGLAEVRAFCRVGRIHEGLAAAAPLERAARALQYGPLLAEVLVTVCRLPEEQGDMETAARISEEALLTALVCRHEEVAAEAATLLIGHASLGAVGTELHAAEVWCRLAEALLRRIGGHDLLWGWLFTNRAGLRAKQGRMVEALEDARLSVAAKEKALGPEQPDVGISLSNVSVHLDELGHFDAAVEQGARALEIVERGFGPDHPRTALLRSNYSEYLARSGRWDEASDAAARALASFEREADPEGIFVFVGLTALGTAHLGAGRREEAVPILERATRIGEASAPTAAYLARARFALGRALWETEAERGRALALMRAARQDYQRSQPTPSTERELAAVDAWLNARAGEW
jgi:eukaryotic-like serine/threonine-protein kinase